MLTPFSLWKGKKVQERVEKPHSRRGPVCSGRSVTSRMGRGISRFCRASASPSVRVAELSFKGKLRNFLLFLGSFSQPDYCKYYIKTAVFAITFVSFQQRINVMVCQSSQSSVAVMSGCVVVSVLFRFLFFWYFFFFLLLILLVYVESQVKSYIGFQKSQKIKNFTWISVVESLVFFSLKQNRSFGFLTMSFGTKNLFIPGTKAAHAVGCQDFKTREEDS